MARSRVAELADEEAARVAAELGDNGEEDEGAAEEPGEGAEPEPVEEPEPGEGEEPEQSSSALMVHRLEAEARRHQEVLAAIFGATFEAYEACPLCTMLGFVAAPTAKEDKFTSRCPDCDGIGQTLTGAAQTAEFARTCPRCMGNGWIPRSDVAQPVPAVTAGAPPPPPAPPAVEVPPMPVYDAATNQWLVNGVPVVVAS